jgi:aromatic-amino-acid transaminase
MNTVAHERQLARPAGSFFGALPPVGGDPIFALNDEFRRDPRAFKANLGIGVYCDDEGRVPMLGSVKKAALAMAQEGEGSGYLPIEGSHALRDVVQALLFGSGHPAVSAQRVATLQTVGASGALRLAGELLRAQLQVPGVWISDPSWHNHRALFEAAGLRVESYPYLDPRTGGLRFEEMLAALEQIPPRGVVLLHGCCHNPTGVDLSPVQWRTLAEVLQRRRLMPFVDLAYQGFGEGVDEDAYAVRCLADAGLELLVAHTFSKSFSLYAERVGSLSIVAASRGDAATLLQHMKAVVSQFYFSPPAAGARLVARVLQAPELSRQWQAELATMRARVDVTRRRLARALEGLPAAAQWPGLATTRGMFAYPNLGRGQVESLKRQEGVYLAPNGRLCIAALNDANFAQVVQALAQAAPG